MRSRPQSSPSSVSQSPTAVPNLSSTTGNNHLQGVSGNEGREGGGSEEEKKRKRLEKAKELLKKRKIQDS